MLYEPYLRVGRVVARGPDVTVVKRHVRLSCRLLLRVRRPPRRADARRHECGVPRVREDHPLLRSPPTAPLPPPHSLVS